MCDLLINPYNISQYNSSKKITGMNVYLSKYPIKGDSFVFSSGQSKIENLPFKNFKRILSFMGNFKNIDSQFDGGVKKANIKDEQYIYDSARVFLPGQDDVSNESKIEFCEHILSQSRCPDLSLLENLKLTVKNRIEDPIELLNSMEKLSTPYDTPEIIVQRAYNLANGRLKILGSRKPMELRKHPVIGPILEDACQRMQSVAKDKKLYVVAGNPASGKSTYCHDNKLTKENGYFLIDSDEIKKQLPYYDELGNNFVHDVSAFIALTQIAIAARSGTNIVFPTTGTGVLAIEIAQKYGYDVEVLFCELPAEECVERSLKRYKNEKRFVDPHSILENDKYLEKLKNIANQHNLDVRLV